MITPVEEDCHCRPGAPSTPSLAAARDSEHSVRGAVSAPRKPSGSQVAPAPATAAAAAVIVANLQPDDDATTPSPEGEPLALRASTASLAGPKEGTSAGGWYRRQSGPPAADTPGGKDKSPRFRISLRFVALPVVVGVLVAAVIAIALVNYRNADATAETLSSQLLMHVGRRVYENVVTVFTRAMRIAETNARVAAAPLVKPVQVTPADFDRAMATARGTLHSNPTVWSVALILGDGTGFLYRREQAEWQAATAPRPIEPFTFIETVLTNGSRLDRHGYYFREDTLERQLMWTERPALLDPRTRPFWKAVEATQAAAWTPAYVLLYGGGSALTVGGLGVSYSLPFFYSPSDPTKRTGEGKMQGIISMTLEIGTLSEFVASIQVTESGFAVVLSTDASGKRFVIAYRDPSVLTTAVWASNASAPSYTLTPVENLPDPLLRAFVQSLPADAEGRARLDAVSALRVGENDFSHGGRVYRSRFFPVRVPVTPGAPASGGARPGELKILIGVVTPDDDIRALVYLNARVSSIIGSVGFAVIIALVAVISVEMTRQLRHFSREVEAVAALRTGAEEPERRLGSFVKELHTFGAAIGKMRSLLAIITGMMDAVFVVDGAGRVAKLNARALALFGVPRPEEVLGAAFAELFVDAACRERFRELLLPAPGPKPGPAPAPAGAREFVCVRPGGGGRFPAEISAGRVRTAGGEMLVLVVRDVSERHALLESLRESESKAVLLAHDLRCLIQYSNAPIFAVDPAGLVVEWNAAMAKATGCRREEALGQPVLAFVAEEGRAALRETLAGVLERGREVENHEVEFLCRPSAARRLASAHASVASGSESEVMTPAEEVLPGQEPAALGRRTVRLMVNAAGRRDLAGSIVGAICVGQDMSEKVRMIEMKAAAHAKARLIAYVCVRSAGAAGPRSAPALLSDTDLSAEQHDYLQSMNQCSEQLLSVVNDLLDLSKLEAGMVTVESIAFDLRDVIECVAELVAPACYTKGIEIVCAISPDIPTRVYGDPTRLRQILINLAHNACKFTHDGYVLIRCESAEAVQHAREAAQRAGTAPSTAPSSPLGRRAASPPPLARLSYTISVTDTGMGMDREGVARLFQDFVQVNETITRKYGGTGMGLSISKQLAELMGGRISATSTLGAGTTFLVELPFSPVPAPAPAGPPLPGPSGAQPDRRPSNQLPSSPGDLRLDPPVSVLVATSCAPVREALAAYLAALGCPVAFARSAARARALLRGPHRFDAVLVDDDLPAHEAADGASGRFSLGPAASSKAAALPAPEGAAAAPPLSPAAGDSGRRRAGRGGGGCGGRGVVAAGPEGGGLFAAERGPGVATALLREHQPPRRRPHRLGTPPPPPSATGEGSALAPVPEAAAEPSGRAPAWLAKPLRLVKLYLLLGSISRQAQPGASLPGAVVSSRRNSGVRRGSPMSPPLLPVREEPSALPPPLALGVDGDDGGSARRGSLALGSDLESFGSEAPGAGATPPPPRVLLVEDQALNQKIVEQMLRRVGIEIEVAWDGQEAVDRFAAGPAPDLILMDMQMPRLDGCEATLEIRRLEREGGSRVAEPAGSGRSSPRPRVPIVALTANAMSADERRCYSSGMDAVLRKPVKRDELLAALDKFTPWRRPAPAGPAVPAAPASSASLVMDAGPSTPSGRPSRSAPVSSLALDHGSTPPSFIY
eukprot:tig00000147_g9514.t1